MTWMLTASGTAFDLRYLKHADVHIADIAHHLAQINRYTGACRRPYSVAEHSLLVVDLLEHQGCHSPSVLMAALLHDAHEAYTTDLSSPMKQLVGPAWDAQEKRIQRHVLARYAVLVASTQARPLIHWADLTALTTERAQLLPPGHAFEAEATHPAVDWVDLASRDGFAWTDWRQAFQDKFDALDYARTEGFAMARAAIAGAIHG